MKQRQDVLVNLVHPELFELVLQLVQRSDTEVRHRQQVLFGVAQDVADTLQVQAFDQRAVTTHRQAERADLQIERFTLLVGDFAEPLQVDFLAFAAALELVGNDEGAAPPATRWGSAAPTPTAPASTTAPSASPAGRSTR